MAHLLVTDSQSLQGTSLSSILSFLQWSLDTTTIVTGISSSSENSCTNLSYDRLLILAHVHGFLVNRLFGTRLILGLSDCVPG